MLHICRLGFLRINLGYVEVNDDFDMFMWAWLVATAYVAFGIYYWVN